jgi:SAM-dependent methyltransferase
MTTGDGSRTTKALARPYVPAPSQSRQSPSTGAREPGDWDSADELTYFHPDAGNTGDSGADGVNPFFAAPLRAYVAQAGPGDPVTVLQAGCLAPLRELGIGQLTRAGFAISVSVTDEDTPVTRQVLAATGPSYSDITLGDLRSVALPPRGFDIVYCAGLLEHVKHVELVLDHLTGTLKPGGLLLIRMGDRRAASAVLDRVLPTALRRKLWHDLRPGIPGPFPAIYERPVSERGIYSYTLMRGLVIAQQTAEPTLPTNPARLSSSVRVTCGAIARFSRGRYGDDHDELLYVIRKPQDRFARVV